jgi:hypothetical protein
MAYTLVYSGGNITVVDGTLNTTATSIALPGRNYSGYGSPVDQNFVSMLENFASANAGGPSNPIKGQFWFDSTTSNMKFNTSSSSTPSWATVAVNSPNANVEFNNIVANSITANTANIGNLTLTGYLMHSVSASVAAAGTVQTDATALTKTINLVTSGSLNQGIRLPSAAAGMVIYVTNASGATLKVYPSTGAQINSLGTNAAFSIGANSTVHFIAPTTTQWYSTSATYA